MQLLELEKETFDNGGLRLVADNFVVLSCIDKSDYKETKLLTINYQLFTINYFYKNLWLNS